MTKGARPAAPSVARLLRVAQSYGGLVALAGIDLEIPKGIMVGLIGPDGVGKSTLLGLIAGVRRIQSGSVEVLGGDMADAAHRSAVCTRIAYMPQGLGQNLYGALSVRENIAFFAKLFGVPRREAQARRDRLLAVTGLAPFARRKANKLSGGMKQKLGLCCALIHEPELLILDEPTTGVDPLSRRGFWELIGAMRKQSGMSVLVATAYMEEAEPFDHLVMLDEGRMLAAGSPAELKSQTGCDSLEAAYTMLLPEAKRAGQAHLVIPPRKPSPDGPAIEASGLTRRFGDFTAVDNLTFTIERGEIFGFVGPNGSGKTTTMTMVTGLLPMSEGAVRLFGEPVRTGSRRLRRRLGYMSQSFSLYADLTVRENLRLHGHLFDLSGANLDNRIATLAARFELGGVMDRRADALPLGVRQRLALAVAIIHEPELLILDEPTSGVDPVARDRFWGLIVELSRERGVTIFVSTHYLNEAERCDRVALMNAGRILACERPAEIVRDADAANLEDAFVRRIGEDMARLGTASVAA